MVSGITNRQTFMVVALLLMVHPLPPSHYYAKTTSASITPYHVHLEHQDHAHSLFSLIATHSSRRYASIMTVKGKDIGTVLHAVYT